VRVPWRLAIVRVPCLGVDRSCVFLGVDRSCVFLGVDRSCVFLGVPLQRIPTDLLVAASLRHIGKGHDFADTLHDVRSGNRALVAVLWLVVGALLRSNALIDRSCVLCVLVAVAVADRALPLAVTDRACSLASWRWRWTDRACSLVLTDRACSLALTDRAPWR